MAGKGKQILLDPVRPSAAIRARLQKELLKRWKWLRGKSYEIIDLYRKYRELKTAADQMDREKKKAFSDSPSDVYIKLDKMMKQVQNRLKDIRNEYNKIFPEKKDKDLAEEFLQWCFRDVKNRNEIDLKKAAKDFTVHVQMTARKKALLQAASHEAAGLIKNIGTRAQLELEGAVNRCFMEGRNIGELTEALEKVLHTTRRRAINLAFDQTNKVSNSIDRQVKLDLGLNKAIWRHSHAHVRTKPRADHVAADGREYDLNRGCLISGEYLYPGQAPFCGCYSQAVLTLPEVKE